MRGGALPAFLAPAHQQQASLTIVKQRRRTEGSRYGASLAVQASFIGAIRWYFGLGRVLLSGIWFDQTFAF